MKGAGTASSPLLVGPQEEEAGTKPSPPLALLVHELALRKAYRAAQQMYRRLAAGRLTSRPVCQN